MKTFFAFLKWHWNSWDLYQKFWILGAAFFGAGITDYYTTGQPGLAIKLAWTLWMLVFIKWFFWDTVVHSWKRFKDERKELFNTIDKGK